MPIKKEPFKRRTRGQSISNHPSFYNLYELLLQELGLNYLSIDSDNFNSNNNDKEIEKNYDELLENILHFIKIPFYIEKFMIFGLLYCLNDFLIIFTILPIKLTIFIIQLFILLKKKYLNQSTININNSGVFNKNVNLKNLFLINYNSVIQLVLLTICLSNLSYLDISKLYHDIRRQSAIKLYVMIGVLDVVDKLISKFGEDLWKLLFNFQFIFLQKDLNLKRVITFLIVLLLSIIYLTCHSICLIYQTICLNVAINSYSNALFTLLLSSQFSEIKSTVFKKFEREGLFQNICSDLTERFQLLIYLLLIGFRNLIEIDLNNDGLIPNFWKNYNNKILKVFLNPILIVIGSELLVDWLKHCYITKFNNFNYKIYNRFLNILTNDFLENYFNFELLKIDQKIYKKINKTKSLSVRIGCPIFVLNLIFLKIIFSTYSINFNFLVLIFLILFTLKLINCLILLKISNKKKLNYLKNLKLLKNETNFNDYLLKNDYKPNNSSVVGMGLIDKNDLNYLYDNNEEKFSLIEKKINKDVKIIKKNLNSIELVDEVNLDNIVRYKMSSKQIW